MKAALLFLCMAFLSSAAMAKPEPLKYGRFGEIRVRRGAGEARSLLIWARGGESAGALDVMETAFAAEGTLVASFDTSAYLARLAGSGKKCLYPAGDLELLSKFLQKKLKFKDYSHPLLTGSGIGASLVYGALAQAPSGTFQGAVSLGFCAALETARPLCKGFGLESRAGKKGYDLAPSRKDLSSWGVLQGESDRSCPLEAAQKFVAATKGARLTVVPEAGHDFSAAKKWSDQFQEERSRLQPSTPVSQGSEPLLSDLPVVPLPAENAKGDTFVIFLSGDGGWAEFDKDLSQTLVDKGIPVVGLNSLRYFWEAKTPEQGARDLERIYQAYSQKWKKKKVIVAGFSFGADAAPAFVNRLPSAVKDKVRKVVLISAGKTADFEFHFSDWISDEPEGLALKPEVLALAKTAKVLCFYGEDEAGESGCPTFKASGIEAVGLDGGHHIEIGESQISKIIQE